LDGYPETCFRSVGAGLRLDIVTVRECSGWCENKTHITYVVGMAWVHKQLEDRGCQNSVEMV